jgi:hypothetical protein
VIKLGALMLTLYAAAACTAQVPIATAQSSTPARHFRLTFVLSYPQDQKPSQSFVLDVPVRPDRPGTANMSGAAGSTGEIDGIVKQTLRCSEVRLSPTGLTAKVAFSIDSVSSEPLPGSDEPLHNQLTFERQIDVVLAKPTRITEEMHSLPLSKGVKKPLAPPQITVTATEI